MLAAQGILTIAKPRPFVKFIETGKFEFDAVSDRDFRIGDQSCRITALIRAFLDLRDMIAPYDGLC